MTSWPSRALAALSLCAVLASAPIARAQAPEPAPMEIEVQRGLEYARHDGVTLAGDLYVPKAGGKYPVVVAVHGGGWQAGNRAAYQSWGNWLAARGHALYAITYRLSKPNEKSYPQAVHDLRAAIQFLKGRGQAIKVDPERIALMGDSAGAHLVALVALAGDHPHFAGAYKDDAHAALSTKVKAVVGGYGVYDMAQQFNHDLLHRPNDQIVAKFLGASLWQDRKLYFDASPLSHAAVANRGTSFLLAYGKEDDIVDTVQSESFLIALKQAGFYARSVVLPGFGHFWFTGDPVDDPRGATAFLAPRVLRFFRDRL